MDTAILLPLQDTAGRIDIYEKKLFKPGGMGRVRLAATGQEILVAVLPAGLQKLCGINEKKRARLWEKTAKMLLDRGIKTVYLPDELAGLADLSFFGRYFFLPDGRRVFASVTHDILRKLAKQRGADLASSEVGLWQSEFDELGYAFLDAIAGSLKYVTLFTDDYSMAQRCADNIYAQTGLSVCISPGCAHMNKCDFVIFADAPPQITLRDNMTVIDASGSYGRGCVNTVQLSAPPGFEAVAGLCGGLDQRAGELLLRAGGYADPPPGDIPGLLSGLGCRLKGVAFKKASAK